MQLTYVSLFVQLIIGELELIKVDDHVHPVGAQGRRVWVHVQAGGGALLFKAADPSRVLVLVAIFVDWDHVHVQSVGGVGVEIEQFHFERWKHPSIVI